MILAFGLKRDKKTQKNARGKEIQKVKKSKKQNSDRVILMASYNSLKLWEFFRKGPRTINHVFEVKNEGEMLFYGKMQRLRTAYPSCKNKNKGHQFNLDFDLRRTKKEIFALHEDKWMDGYAF